ncbi:hypothetical protein RND81_09G139900 [Saponaria officinalis]
MIAPIHVRQHEILPASVNPCRGPAIPGLNDFGIPEWPGKGLADEGIGLIGNSILHSTHALCTPNRSPVEQLSPFPQVGEKPWVYQPPCPEERKFLVFDQSGNETRLMFSSVTPTLCPMWNPQVVSAKQFDTSKLLGGQAGKDEHVCTKTSVICEESGENESLDEELEMREDTEEINALLYSDDDDEDNEYEDEDDDVVSSGRSPLERESDIDDEVAISSVSSKRRKTLEGGHEKVALINTTISEERNSASEKIHSTDFVSAVDEGTIPNLGSKRPRKDKIDVTLKVLESLLPGLNNKNPVVILDEAIRYLKCLKYNAESTSLDDSDSSGCYETLN